MSYFTQFTGMLKPSPVAEIQRKRIAKAFATFAHSMRIHSARSGDRSVFVRIAPDERSVSVEGPTFRLDLHCREMAPRSVGGDWRGVVVCKFLEPGKAPRTSNVLAHFAFGQDGRMEPHLLFAPGPQPNLNNACDGLLLLCRLIEEARCHVGTPESRSGIQLRVRHLPTGPR